MKNVKKLNEKNQIGITLIVLVVTTVVLLILASTSISMLTGDEGIITNAQNSKISTELSEYKEQLEIYISNKKIENTEFNKETLFAGKDTLRYNTQKDGEKGTIETICPKMKSKYVEKIQIKKGKLILDTKDKREIKIAVGLGIEVKPYEIEDGELIASDDNLLLIDSNGTLKLPESVTTIGERAFSNTASDGVELKRVIMPSTVREIKANAFNGNDQIEEIVIETKNGKGVTTIGNYAFARCGNLKRIELPDTVITIGENLFLACTSLKDVKLSKNITSIGYQMFHSCKELQEVEVPEGVSIIKAGAFLGCTNLTKLTFPSTLKTIEQNAIISPKLNDIKFNNNPNFIFENGILMNIEKTEMQFVSSTAINGDTFVVPNKMRKLYANLLSAYNGIIKKVIIPETVDFIEVSFFPHSIEEIEINKNNPKYIVINKSIYNKDKTILYANFSKDTDITVEEGVKEIAVKAFLHTNAVTITFPDSVEKINAIAISQSTLKKVTIGKNVKEINKSAFSGCVNLTEVKIDEKNLFFTVENGIIYNKEKNKIIAIATYSENITIADGVTEIPDQIFVNRYTIKNIVLPESIIAIGRSAFSACSALTKIEIPSSVNSIGLNCFENTPKLKEIVINKEKDSIYGSPWGSMYGERAIIWSK